MATYRIQHRIKTKADCIKPFEIDNYKFRHEKFDHANGWEGDYWVVEKEIAEENWVAAINKFRSELSKITLRISFVSQCALEFWAESFCIYNKDYEEEIILVRHSVEVDSASLHFDMEELGILEKLNNSSIDQSFFEFMLESSNASTAYTRLYMLFSAIENLGQGRRKIKCENCEYEREVDSADPKILKKILGGSLYGKCWGRNGFRHQMSHGKFPRIDGALIEEVYKKIISYLNEELDISIREDVVSPQRSFTGSKRVGMNFYELEGAARGDTAELPEIISILDKSIGGQTGMLKFVGPDKYLNSF